MEKAAEFAILIFLIMYLKKKWKKVSSPLLRIYFLLEIEQSK